MKMRAPIILQILLVYLAITIWSVHGGYTRGINPQGTHNFGKLRVLSVSDVYITLERYPHKEAMRLLNAHEIIDTHSGKKVTVDDNGDLTYHDKVTQPPKQRAQPPKQREPEPAVRVPAVRVYPKGAPRPRIPEPDPSNAMAFSSGGRSNPASKPGQPDPYSGRAPSSGGRSNPVPNHVGNAPSGRNLPQPQGQHMNPAEFISDGSASYSSSGSGSSSSSASDAYYEPGVGLEDEDSSPWPLLFGMVLMIFIVLSGIGIYFLVVKVMSKKNGDEKPTSGHDRGPLPSTPGEKGKRRPSKASSKKDISDHEIDQLRDAPAPPSKHYLDDDDDLYDSPSQLHDEDDEPDYMEFEG